MKDKIRQRELLAEWKKILQDTGERLLKEEIETKILEVINSLAKKKVAELKEGLQDETCSAY